MDRETTRCICVREATDSELLDELGRRQRSNLRFHLSEEIEKELLRRGVDPEVPYFHQQRKDF